jgi:hypothetical protein
MLALKNLHVPLEAPARLRRNDDCCLNVLEAELTGGLNLPSSLVRRLHIRLHEVSGKGLLKEQTHLRINKTRG